MHSWTKVTLTKYKLKIHKSSHKIAVPPHQALDPLHDAHSHHCLCYGMASLTSLQILKPIRYEQGRIAYCHQAPDTTQLKCIWHIDCHLPLLPHCIPRHRKSKVSMFIPRSKTCSCKGHVEWQKTTEWRWSCWICCNLSLCWVVNMVLGVVWRGRSQAQWRMRSLCWRGRVGLSEWVECWIPGCSAIIGHVSGLCRWSREDWVAGA